MIICVLTKTPTQNNTRVKRKGKRKMADTIALRAYLRNVIGLGTDAAGLERSNTTIAEGLNSIEDLAELNADKGVKSMTANIRKPGGSIPDHNWVNPGNGSVAPMIARPGQTFPTICEQRMILAAYGAFVYDSIGRTVDSDGLSRSRLRELKIHREMVQNHSEAKELDEVSKSFPVTKFLDQFPTYLKELLGVSKIFLSYVIRDSSVIPIPLPNLLPNKPWGAPHNNLMDELVAYTPHNGTNYNSDNARVFGILAKALSGTNALASITRHQRTQNGRGAYLDLITHHMGSVKWEKMVELAEAVLNLRIWNGRNSRYPLRMHIVRHREAFNDMQRASEHIAFTPPDETTRVRHLMTSIQTPDPTIISAKTNIHADPTKKNDFEQAADFLLQVAPTPNTTGTNHRISALKHGKRKNGKGGRRGEIKTGPKTGVELRYYKRKEWMEDLSQEQRDECQEIRRSETSKRRGSNDIDDERAKKIAALESKLAEQERKISALTIDKKNTDTTLPPTPQRNPLQPPSGFTQRK